MPSRCAWIWASSIWMAGKRTAGASGVWGTAAPLVPFVTSATVVMAVLRFGKGFVSNSTFQPGGCFFKCAKDSVPYPPACCSTGFGADTAPHARLEAQDEIDIDLHVLDKPLHRGRKAFGSHRRPEVEREFDVLPVRGPDDDVLGRRPAKL